MSAHDYTITTLAEDAARNPHQYGTGTGSTRGLVGPAPAPVAGPALPPPAVFRSHRGHNHLVDDMDHAVAGCDIG